MKNWKHIILLSALIFVSACLTQGQSITKISQRCPNPNGSLTASVQALAIGDILHTPCPARSSIFTGNVDFSGATIIGGGFVTGTGTTNFIPRWTNGAGSVLGDTPFSWSGTVYTFNNTALNSTFSTVIRPSTTIGSFTTGTATTFLSVLQATNTISNQLAPTTGIWNVTDATNFSAVFDANADVFRVLNTTSDTGITFTSGTAGSLRLGDCSTTVNNCIEQLYSTGNTTITAASSIILQDPSGLSNITLNTAGDLFGVQARQGITLDSGSTNTAIGDTAGGGNSTLFTVDDASRTYIFSAGSSLGVFNLTAINNFQLQCTNTAAGTTGNRTINTPCGSVNFAALATDITVTNSVALATSNILCTVQGLDVTAISCRVTNRANGSFHIRVPAATAEVPVSFWVLN